MPRPLGLRPLSVRAAAAPLVGVLVLAAFLVLGAARPAGACACGVALGAKAGAERALLSLEDGRQEIVLGLDLSAPDASVSGRRAAVLLPVPATPTVTTLDPDEAAVFAQLERATATLPRPRSDDEEPTDGAVAPAPPGVSVLSRERIGGYDVTRLRAGDARALRGWLDRGGYETPAAAEPILRDYVRRDWAFVAIRLAAPIEGRDGTLSPLRVSFPAKRLVYPLRLSSQARGPVDVQLYVAGEHRVVATNFDTFFAGFVSSLRPPLSAPVRRMVRGPYLTRLRIASDDPARITSDVHFRQGVSDRLFRSSEDYPFETEENFALGPLPSALAGPEETLTDAPDGALWLALFPVIGLTVLAVFGVLRLRERLRRRR